jgi:hypothetical protein
VRIGIVILEVWMQDIWRFGSLEVWRFGGWIEVSECRIEMSDRDVVK